MEADSDPAAQYLDHGLSSASKAAHQLALAVNSIPAYIEMSTHFFVICPEVQHLNARDQMCTLSSWQERGWCRVEETALLMAQHVHTPAIVVKGGASPFMRPLARRNRPEMPAAGSAWPTEALMEPRARLCSLARPRSKV